MFMGSILVRDLEVFSSKKKKLVITRIIHSKYLSKLQNFWIKLLNCFLSLIIIIKFS